MPLYTSSLASLNLINRGKVRDIYEIDASRLLIITTDRLSAFDVVLPTPIPDKGRILTALSNMWFDRLSGIIPSHLTHEALESFVTADEKKQVEGRGIIVKRLQPLATEAIVRGYLAGSGWKEYGRKQSVCGIALPAGLREADALPEPIFTPSTKAAQGAHDENITFEQAERMLGANLANRIREISLTLYEQAAVYAKERGIIIADTKFEFGLDEDDKLYLIDEVLTPDSSRFWPVDEYKPGSNPPSFDKQYVRDYLESIGWEKTPPGPELPAEIVEKTRQKYQEALTRLTHSP